jgi:uncharacterized membrane protein YraQ (UPF0718 family)
MRKLLKRYAPFLLLLVAYVLIGILAPDIGQSAVKLTVQNVTQMLTVIPPIFVLLGLLDVWGDRATMIRYTGKGSGLKGVLIAFFLGSVAAGPLYAAFPVAAVMLKKGSRLFNVFVFIGAWSTTKIPLLTFEAASLGFAFTLTRLALNLGGILAIAAITERSLNSKQQEEIYAINSGIGI